jgi:hypothetical protein
LNNEKKPKRLQELSFELKEQVDKVLQNNKYVVWGGHDEEPLTKEMLSYLGTREMVSQEIGQDAISINSFEEIAFALQKAKFEIKFQETVGLIDKERLREETKKYGAKGANLQMILEVIQAIQNITWSLDESCFIPDFERIPVSVYRKWKNGESIRSELEPFFAWINQRNVMVRSSAVYSEDNEETTGAGIYESLSLDEGVTIDDFESAVVSVFKSVDTDEAKKYRAQNGVQLEEMGIVLQESVSYFSNHDKGYVNTVLKQVPQLMDIVFESGFRPVLRKNAIEHKCANASEEQSLFHYQIDWHKYDDSMSIERLAMLSFLLEKYYGQTLQIEFILAEKEDQHSYSRGKQIAILQTRFLPKKFSESAQIEFPQKELLFEGRALGITDTILDILPNYKDNSEHEGVVIFESSRFGSMGHNFSDYNFPKKGVVVVLGPSIENFGHIETLCAEKGLFLIFNCNYHSQRESSMAGLGFSGNMG